MKADIRLEHQLLAVQSEHVLNAMLELVAPPAPHTATRPALHLALVIDRSGSMAGPKLETTKRCAEFLVSRLQPTDELAIVTYDGHVHLLAPLAPVTDPAHLRALIASIVPGGQTNLSGGWLKGVEVLKGATGDGPRKVLLLTDGQANVGVVEPPRLTSMAQHAAGENVGTTTIGFGDGFDEDLLTAMADAGQGRAHFAATPDDAPAIFTEEFEGLLSLVAQNVSVEIRPTEHVDVLGVLNDYPQVPVAGGVQIQLGDAYADERRRVVFRLQVPQMARLGVERIADIVIRHTEVEPVAMHETTVPVIVNLVSADEAAATGPDAEVTEEVLVLEAAKAEEEAIQKADAGDFDGARAVLGTWATRLREAAPNSAKAAELEAHAERLTGRHAHLAPRTWGAEARKNMRYDSNAVKRGRPRPRKEGPR